MSSRVGEASKMGRGIEYLKVLIKRTVEIPALGISNPQWEKKVHSFPRLAERMPAVVIYVGI